MKIKLESFWVRMQQKFWKAYRQEMELMEKFYTQDNISDREDLEAAQLAQ